ncbi:MAG: hypothetical protein K6F91_03190 [Ruminococcus sp.]|nr:hypothetical protein [Ruminococcus sp.]
MVFCKLLVSLALVMSAASADADVDYEGEINIFTGEPIVDEDGNEEKQTVRLLDEGVYDFEQETYTYTVPSDGTMKVISSVPNKMITTDSVSIDTEGGVSVSIYLDGELLDEVDFSDIDMIGSYAVVATSADSEDQVLSFTIIPEKTGMISSYQLPEGFELTEVILDDEEQDITDKNMVKLKKDGEYVISYRCKATGVEYGLKTEIDHTPPALEIDGVEDNKARGAVTVSGIDRNDTVEMTMDGEDYDLPKDGVIKMPGKYEISVTDDAGNTVSDEFEIKFYLDRQGLIFGLLALGVILGAIAYMIVARKKLRVR